MEFEVEVLPLMDDLFRATVRVVQDQGKPSDAGQSGYRPTDVRH
jgi:hypothetical protein